MAAIIAIVIMLMIAAGLSVLGWKIDGWLAPAQGAAQQKIQNNDPNNRATAQDAFNRLHSAIEVDLSNIKNDEALYGQVPTDGAGRAQTGLDRAKCEADVAEFNTDASDMNMKDWRPADLPPEYEVSICQR